MAGAFVVSPTLDVGGSEVGGDHGRLTVLRDPPVIRTDTPEFKVNLITENGSGTMQTILILRASYSERADVASRGNT